MCLLYSFGLHVVVSFVGIDQSWVDCTVDCCVGGAVGGAGGGAGGGAVGGAVGGCVGLRGGVVDRCPSTGSIDSGLFVSTP